MHSGTSSMEVTRCSTVSLALSYLFCGINATTRIRSRETKGGYSLPMLKHIISHARKRAEIRIKRSTATSSLTPETETDTPTDNAHDNDIDSVIPFSEKAVTSGHLDHILVWCFIWVLVVSKKLIHDKVTSLPFLLCKQQPSYAYNNPS